MLPDDSYALNSLNVYFFIILIIIFRDKIINGTIARYTIENFQAVINAYIRHANPLPINAIKSANLKPIVRKTWTAPLLR